MPSRCYNSGNGKQITQSSLWQLFCLILMVLIAIGFFNVYSSTFYMNLDNGVNPYSHLLRHAGYFLVGFLIFCVLWQMPFRQVPKVSSLLIGLTAALLVLIFAGFGRTVNGATRWIYVGISIQPSEIAKVAAILWTAPRLAGLLKKGVPITLLQALLWNVGRRFLPLKADALPAAVNLAELYRPLLIPLLFAFLVILQPDMGTAVLILGFPILLYMLCGVPRFDMILTLVLAVFGFLMLALMEPYRWERVKVLWDPFSYSADAGYQTVQSLIAVGSGGFFGQGAGEGLSKFLYLPEQHTDFAFAILAQEGGFLLAGTVIVLFAALFFVGFLMASRIPRLYPALLVYGLTMLIALEGFLNMAMVIGSFPVTGVPLPFISFGGSSLVMNMAAVGLIGCAVRYGIQMERKDEEARKREALTGEPVSLSRLSGTVFRPMDRGMR